jgi:hypothetical protein
VSPRALRHDRQSRAWKQSYSEHSAKASSFSCQRGYSRAAQRGTAVASWLSAEAIHVTSTVRLCPAWGQVSRESMLSMKHAWERHDIKFKMSNKKWKYNNLHVISQLFRNHIPCSNIQHLKNNLHFCLYKCLLKGFWQHFSLISTPQRWKTQGKGKEKAHQIDRACWRTMTDGKSIIQLVSHGNFWNVLTSFI